MAGDCEYSNEPAGSVKCGEFLDQNACALVSWLVGWVGLVGLVGWFGWLVGWLGWVGLGWVGFGWLVGWFGWVGWVGLVGWLVVLCVLDRIRRCYPACKTVRARHTVI
jgi:hypothetical protein